MQVIVPNAARGLFAAAVSMLLVSACSKSDLSTDPGSQIELNKSASDTAALGSATRRLSVSSNVPAAVDLYRTTQARKLEQFRQDHGVLLAEMIAEARGDQQLTGRSNSRAGQCAAARRIAGKYGARFSANAKRMDVDLGPGFMEELLGASPLCRSNNGMSVFALNPAMLGVRFIAVARLASVDEIDDAVEALLNDSLTAAGYDRLEAIDLSGATSMAQVDAILNANSAHGLGTIDRAIFNAGKEEVRNQYAATDAVDWENLPEPYMIFDPFFGWRRPTWPELWATIGGGCLQAVRGSYTAIRTAAFAGARVGFVAGLAAGGPGAAVLGGVVDGGISAAAAAAVPCAAGSAAGGLVLLGLIHTQ